MKRLRTVVGRAAAKFRTTASSAPAAGVPSETFHAALHELRTIELERAPKQVDRVLSVGAQGRWYFEWFRQSVGDVTEHVGIEAFEPKPDDLPPYATWIANTADHMHDVGSGVIDMVFAGQTTEHLWAGELVGFLQEAHRVLRPEGWLVLDSPNRAITQFLHWSHGGHTIELDQAEMSELLDLAGFDVRSVSGLWHCLDGERVLQLEDGLERTEVLVRRAAIGRDVPDECFVWWIVAQRRSDASSGDQQRLRDRVDELFEAHWDTRVSRGLFAAPGSDLVIGGGRNGRIGATLPFPLHQGQWMLALDLASGTWDDVPELVVRIVSPGDHVQHEFRPQSATVDGTRLSWSFQREEFTQALSITIDAGQPRGEVQVAFPLQVRPV